MAGMQTIRVRLFWREAEPDGSQCMVCDETCWLKMWRAFAEMNGKLSKGPLGCRYVMCDSCNDQRLER